MLKVLLITVERQCRMQSFCRVCAIQQSEGLLQQFVPANFQKLPLEKEHVFC